MMDYITIGSSPAAEDCAQLGSEGYYERSKAEIRALKGQMIRILGEPPFGVTLKMKGFDHDFGRYHELVAVYDENDEEATAYAFRAENELPEHWDEQALRELAEANFPATRDGKPVLVPPQATVTPQKEPINNVLLR